MSDKVPARFVLPLTWNQTSAAGHLQLKAFIPLMTGARPNERPSTQSAGNGGNGRPGSGKQMTRSPGAWAVGAEGTAGEGARRVYFSQDREPGIWKVGLPVAKNQIKAIVSLRTGSSASGRWGCLR